MYNHYVFFSLAVTSINAKQRHVVK